MKVYHMSDTLCLGAELSLNYKKYWELSEPFVQALERSEDCFYGACFAATFMSESLDRFGMADISGAQRRCLNLCAAENSLSVAAG